MPVATLTLPRTRCLYPLVASEVPYNFSEAFAPVVPVLFDDDFPDAGSDDEEAEDEFWDRDDEDDDEPDPGDVEPDEDDDPFEDFDDECDSIFDDEDDEEFDDSPEEADLCYSGRSLFSVGG